MSSHQLTDQPVNSQPQSHQPLTSQADNSAYRPFDRVPPELLSCILTFAWLSCSGNDSLDRFRFPSIPCKVNRFFNRTTISTPTLWSYLRVTSVADLPYMQQRVRRSGALPLDLYLIFEGIIYGDAEKLVEGTIMSSPSHFRTITLFYSPKSIICIPNDKLFWDHLNLLSECPIHVARFYLEANYAPLLSSLPPFTSSIRLLDVTCKEFSWPQTPFPRTLEELSITECYDTIISMTEIHRSLSSPLCQSLRSLTLVFIFVEEEEDVMAASCILESLEYLCLGGFYVWGAVMFLSSILTPNLLRLSINTMHNSRTPEAIVTAWKALRFPHLQKLTVQYFDRHHDRLIEFIPNLPDSVKCLEIAGGDVIKTLILPPAAAFFNQLYRLAVREVPLDLVIFLLKLRRTPLQELEVSFQSAYEAHESLTRDQFTNYCDVLRTSVKELKIWVAENDEGEDEPACLTLEQLIASYEDKMRSGSLSSSVVI